MSDDTQVENSALVLVGEATPKLIQVFMTLGPIVREGDWTSWSPEEQVELRKFIAFGYKVFNDTLRPKFDARIWDGQAADGVVSIRKQSDFQTKPGRKAKSEEERLAELMASLEG